MTYTLTILGRTDASYWDGVEHDICFQCNVPSSDAARRKFNCRRITGQPRREDGNLWKCVFNG